MVSSSVANCLVVNIRAASCMVVSNKMTINRAATCRVVSNRAVINRVASSRVVTNRVSS